MEASSQAVRRTGGGLAQFSASAGYMPVPLRHVPASALRGIAIYLRRDLTDESASGDEVFTLYRSAEATFTPEDRKRLMAGGNRYVYIRIADHVRFREQSETTLLEVVGDPTKAIAEKSAIVYETSISLMDEILAEADLTAHSRKLENVARSVTTLAISDSSAFTHLFAASRHDFYTATHMVNVGTWMVPLAYALGWRDPDDLARICQAGLLHDIGKIFVASEILNKTGRLSADDWSHIKRHPLAGWEHLRQFDTVHPLIAEICRQHHERMDGTGYPDGLAGDRIHRVARICAVVDSFDAMTALRPFKEKSKSVSEAIMVLKSETPAKYDPEVVEAWLKLLGPINDLDVAVKTGTAASSADQPGAEKRRNRRFACDLAARLHLLTPTPDGGWTEAPDPLHVIVRDVSRHGLGLLSPVEVPPGRHIRVYMNEARTGGKRVNGRVVRCSPGPDGQWELGVELFIPRSGAGNV